MFNCLQQERSVSEHMSVAAESTGPTPTAGSLDRTLKEVACHLQGFAAEHQRSLELIHQQQKKALEQDELCQKIQSAIGRLVFDLDNEPAKEVALPEGNDCIIRFNPDGTLPGAKAGKKPASAAVEAFKTSEEADGVMFDSESEIEISWHLGPTLNRTKSLGKAFRSQSEKMPGNSVAKRSLSNVARIIEGLEGLREPLRRGVLATVVQSVYFNLLSLLVILANTCYITVWADYELSKPGEDLAPEQALEWAFSIFYCLELAAKLAVHRCYFFWNEDWSWNCFDFVLVLLVLVENVVSAFSTNSAGSAGGVNIMFIRVLRLFKLARVLRVMRTFRFFRELRLMTECFVGSMMNAVWCVALLMIVKYIFALLIAQAIVGHWSEEGGMQGPGSAKILQYYPSVGGIMVTLLQSTTSGLDWGDAFKALEPTGFVLQGVFIAFILVFTVSIWNIVTSVFVEKALKLAQPDLDAIVVEQMNEEKAMFRNMLDFFSGGKVGTGEEFETETVITPEVFREKVDDPKFRCYLAAQGIEVKNVKTFFSMLSNNLEEPVDLHRLAHACVRMKGFATSLDLQSLGFESKLMHQRQLQILRRMKDQLRQSDVAIQKILQAGNFQYV